MRSKDNVLTLNVRALSQEETRAGPCGREHAGDKRGSGEEGETKHLAGKNGQRRKGRKEGRSMGAHRAARFFIYAVKPEEEAAARPLCKDALLSNGYRRAPAAGGSLGVVSITVLEHFKRLTVNDE